MSNENAQPNDSETKTRAQTARETLLEAILPEAAFEGWSQASMTRAANTIDMHVGEVELYCPGGVLDLIETWSRQGDDAARTQIEALEPGRIRDRITQAVLIRLAQYDGHEEAAERARARLLLPDALDRSTQLIWATSDMIWRAIGDQSTDGNFYSKRAVLSGVYASTLAIWIGEKDPEKPKTRAFLDRRISGVMEFEKFKARVNKAMVAVPKFTEFASRLRYGLTR